MFNVLRRKAMTQVYRVLSSTSGITSAAVIASIKTDPKKSHLVRTFKEVKSISMNYLLMVDTAAITGMKDLLAAAKTLDPEAVKIIWAELKDRLSWVESERLEQTMEVLSDIFLADEGLSEKQVEESKAIAREAVESLKKSKGIYTVSREARA